VTVMEEPRVTPGVEDDVEPVKQLSAMGFSRTQAVAALEAHDYDVQRALNSLLGAQ
jgi:epidermal growth factor receptor substrate 15